MNKQLAISIIYTCAKEYDGNLKDKAFLFVWEGKGIRGYQETAFYDSNFMHLTGVKLQGNSISGPKHFYTNCLNNAVSLNDFCFSENGTTELKLRVLPSLMKLHKTAKMFCYYTGGRFKLKTDTLIGGVSGCLGFVKDTYHKQGYFVPNTALHTDIRVEGYPIYRIIAIFSKHVADEKYKSYTTLAKGFELANILADQEISNLCLPYNELTYES